LQEHGNSYSSWLETLKPDCLYELIPKKLTDGINLIPLEFFPLKTQPERTLSPQRAFPSIVQAAAHFLSWNSSRFIARLLLCCNAIRWPCFCTKIVER